RQHVADATKAPIEVTREQLYAQVWETPMTRLAMGYGISGNGLAKICDRMKVPYPPRGYWAKKAAGKKVVTYRLPETGDPVAKSATITPTSPEAKAPPLPVEVQAQIDELQLTPASVVMPERVHRPHKIITTWVERHEQARREGRAN